MVGMLGPEAAQLARRHRQFVGLGAMALTLCSALFMLQVHGANVARVLALETADAARRQAEIESVASSARRHVAALAAGFRAAYDTQDGKSDIPLRARTQDPAAGGGLLDIPAPGPVPSLRDAFLTGPLARLAARAPGDLELAATQALLPLIAAAHAADPNLRWSYYFSASRDFLMIWPPPSMAAAFGDRANAVATYNGYFGYDLYTRTLPAANPSRAPVWTGVYLDAGGAGLMVTHSAPVDIAGRQIGMVGTDVVLKVFSELLAGADPLRLTLLDDGEGHVVADSRGLAAASPAVLPLADLLPATGQEAPPPPGRFRRSGPDYALSLPIAGTPWTLHRVLPAAQVQRAALPALWPYAGFLAAALAALYAVQRQIGRGFVAPAIRMAALLERLSASAPPGSLDAFPPAWRPWAARLIASHSAAAASTRLLAAAEHKTRAILNVALDAVVTADPEGHVVDFNPAAERMFGRSLAEARGRTIGELIVPPAYRAAHEAGMAAHLAQGRVRMLGQRVEVEAMRADGSCFPVEIQIHRLRDIDGVAFAAYIRDLTETRRMAAEASHQAERLHQAEKLSALGSMLAGLAHELNNPLAVVLAQAELADERPGDARNTARISRIRSAADRCGRIVRTFLAMVRQQTPARSSTRLADVLDRALEVGLYGLQSSGVTLVREMDPDLPPLDLDADQIAQVLMNLIVNAQQAMQTGGGPRKLVIRSRREGDRAVLELEDTGPGIPPHMRERIFEPFVTTKPLGVGTGIGLAVCRNVVASHGGSITAGAGAAGGALFRIELPIPLGHAAADAMAAETPAAARGCRVLVVDDEPDVGDALAALLEREGHAVRLVSDIAQALALCAEAAPDLIFCDLHMPDGGALRLAGALAGLGIDPAGRLVFVTGDMVSGPALIAEATGRRDAPILAKPFARDDIARLVATLAGAADCAP